YSFAGNRFFGKFSFRRMPVFSGFIIAQFSLSVKGGRLQGVADQGVFRKMRNAELGAVPRRVS
ncbi:MAG: hypothetical protein IK107_06570, partial [Oscillospiraceae bacterium]|nr:hypothetical protein [Oscillospiraceae bacterium]